MKRLPSLRCLSLLTALLAPGFASSTESDRPVPARLLTGQQAFNACAGCHSYAPGAAHKVGPNLFGLMGRPAAIAEDFDYSPALRAAGLRWTRETVFAWIAGSEALVPDSWMLYDNLLRPEEVMALIDFLEAKTDRSSAQTSGMPRAARQ